MQFISLHAFDFFACSCLVSHCIYYLHTAAVFFPVVFFGAVW